MHVKQKLNETVGFLCLYSNIHYWADNQIFSPVFCVTFTHSEKKQFNQTVGKK